MQIVFHLKSCEEPRQNKIQNHYRFFLIYFLFCFFFFVRFGVFLHFVFTVIGVLNTTKMLMKREMTMRFKYCFP